MDERGLYLETQNGRINKLRRLTATVARQHKVLYSLLTVVFLYSITVGVLASEKIGSDRYLLSKASKGVSDAYATPLIDRSINPKGLAVPSSFLGLHLNRWSDNTVFGLGDLPVPGVLSIVGGAAYFTSSKGYTFYYYGIGAKVKLVGMGDGGKDFETTVLALETPLGPYPTVAKLAATPPKLGPAVIKYPPYVPTFGYGAVRSHDSGVNWVTLNPADGVFNSRLMSAWVARHKGKKLMFTMSGTPEWLATSNIVPETRFVSGNVATIRHAVSSFPIPAGSKIKIRNCANAALNGEWVISASTTTSISFSVATTNESSISDTFTELLLWSNEGSYGYMNPPKDFSKVNVFIAWLMKNYGKNIDWIEGQNEANSGRTPEGKVWYSQGQGLWWAGSFDELGEITRRINVTAKSIKPTVLIGSPAITGMHTGQPINQSPSNRANGFQMLSAGDGAGGKLVDWVDFVPFHIYGYGQSANWQKTGADYKTLYENLYYLKTMLAQPAINKPSVPIYMNEGGIGLDGSAKIYFDSLSVKQQANEIFKIAAIYAGFGVKGFYPFTSGFLGDYETQPEIAAAYDKIDKRIAGKTILPDSSFNENTGAMFYKTSDGYEEFLP